MKAWPTPVLVLSLLGASCGKPLSFQSEESVFSPGEHIHNRVRLIQRDDKDIWMMRQLQKEGWERIAIVVDKSAEPATARFYQLEPGPLEWEDEPRQLPFRVSCFFCHANGPRAIRPLPGTLDVADRARVWALNLRIKSYGRVLSHPDHRREDLSLSRPFRIPHPQANAPVEVAACVHCHREDGLLPRGTLTRQHAATIRHMVKSGHMPPWPFKLSPSEKKELENFLAGF